jgi:lactate dehydrogenase-like 2-hydroxyacid dehydrogenase/phosphoserine aminotransferase
MHLRVGFHHCVDGDEPEHDRAACDAKGCIQWTKAVTMSSIEQLKAQRLAALEATRTGPPQRISNPFFGVGPITNAVIDEVEARRQRFEFEHWLEKNYRKRDDKGRDLGPFTSAEISRSMHRGYPADKFLLDMMREIHTYFGFPKSNRMAIGLGGGHSGFTVAMLHLITGGNDDQHVYVDTPRPESIDAMLGGFFRQSWGAQMVELMRSSKGGNEDRLHFAEIEGAIPSADQLSAKRIKLVFGVGHETTGATNYTADEVRNLLAWIDLDPENHHAMLDATSLLGAMPWGEELVAEITTKCCFFMPFQKAIGGVSGYFVISFTPQALALVEANAKAPIAAIPRQLKLATPVDQKKPLTGARTVDLGPFYDPSTDKMLGGVINTFSTLALAETTFGLHCAAKRVGSVSEMNRRSTENRAAVDLWLSTSTLIEGGVRDASRRGAAVTLLKIRDLDIADPAIHARIIAASKQLLSYEGLTHVNGDREPGLDVARYVNAFPGTPGDYRAWIGGIRETSDVIALLENLQYAYLRAKAAILEEELAKHGVTFEPAQLTTRAERKDDAKRAYKVLITDLVGLKFGKNGKPDPSEVKLHIEKNGAQFHLGAVNAKKTYGPGIHFFYQPDLAAEADILKQTANGQYDCVIAAATPLPKDARFELGGVRIGAGTGNMACACWGGGNGAGGPAPLMNTPSFNSRATAQMAMKALLKVLPDLPVDELHKRSVAGRFDTGRHLKDFPTEKLEGKTIAVIGYGNIGRELAKLATAFGMVVKVHARPRHREWIESEGFIYAPDAEDAATGADVISIHTGLGAFDAKTKTFANAGELGASVLAKLNHGAVVLNYDRGECVDVKALDKAMKSGKVRYASIDADIFLSGKKLSGPLAPYLPLAKKYKGRIELLPHAAADTEHVSRVEGAKQAVDQIIDCIRYKRVTNLKGDVPEGYSNAGVVTRQGVGRASASDLNAALANRKAIDKARDSAEDAAAILAVFATTSQSDQQDQQIKRHGAKLVKAANTLASVLKSLGLEGPYED